MQFNRSLQLFERAQKSIPGGVNSPVRAFKSVDTHPLFIEKGKGSKIYDIDGNEFIDYVGSWGPLILGHCHEKIISAVENALHSGTSFGAPTEGEIQLAEMVKEAVPSIEMLRLVNSGGEATMGAIRVARGFTGRDKIIKFEGCYHGSIDSLLVQAGSGATTLGKPDSEGVPQAFVDLTLLARFNDFDSVSELVDLHPQEIAAIIVEPVPGNMGMILPEHGFLQNLRSLCDREGIVLIFDEVMSGFRVDYGGVQALLNVQPDMTTFGKVIGGGFPVGGYGGRQDIMLQVAPVGPVYQAGTLSGNPIAVTAGIATLELLKEKGVYDEISQKSSWLVNETKSLCEKAGIPIQGNQMGGMFGFFFSETPVRDYQDALKTDVNRFKKFFNQMLRQGIYIAPSAFETFFVSTAHTDEDLEKTAAAIKQALAHL
ncbi:MAG: glutamate-1-semialdehyde 2,1-aminomutase [SAR324 cluster bacterium]|nr:glutamate-1-semialdehyde 2,1-aminomutase [SAR324 cluster bacterium]